MKSNFHTHTERCRHAGGYPKDYAEAAVKNGLEILGISDHAPFLDHDFGYRMPYSELDIYCDEVTQAAEEFAGKVKILKSVEIEFLHQYSGENGYYEFLLNKKKMDYLLCGQHFFYDRGGNFQNITCVPTTEMVIDYAKNCAEAMKTGYFKILAHPDLFCINEAFSWNDDYEKASDILIEGAAKTGVILEYNANGLRRGKKMYPDGERFQYPHIRFWEKVKEAGLPAIVGSDAHSTDVLWDSAVENSIKTLQEMGIKRIETLD